MKNLSKTIACALTYLVLGTGVSYADNQTDDTSPILPEAGLPFRIVIEQTNLQLPAGVHSGVFGVYKGNWIFMAGRSNGMHAFSNVIPNFPPAFQNTMIYVVNSLTGATSSRSLYDAASGLSQRQIDTLSVTSPQGYQDGDTLYMTGGYGIDTDTGTYSTKPVLTAINLPGIIKWVTEPGNGTSVIQNIRQLYNPVFQITGGRMYKSGNVMQLIFGQTFTGEYTDSSNGVYSEQVRLFEIKSDNGQLAVNVYPSKPGIPDPNFRRRDLNVLPTLLNKNNELQYGFVAYSGVFTLSTGVWTVPVVIDSTGEAKMADPDSAASFKQGMNQYACAAAGLYSRKHKSMYHLLFGGLSYGYFSGGVFETDSEIPFTSEVTTIKMDNAGHFTQYIMNNQYPDIPSTQTNPGNLLLFGAGAYFIPNNILQYPNRVISLDTIRKPAIIGHIIGGIASTVPNTTAPEIETWASQYIFKVTLTPAG